jgi:hypothetical protein
MWAVRLTRQPRQQHHKNSIIVTACNQTGGILFGKPVISFTEISKFYSG